VTDYNFRPWGLFPWLLQKIPKCSWSLLGALSTEDRCLTAWQIVASTGNLDKLTLLRIRDPVPSRYSDALEIGLQARYEQFKALGGKIGEVQEHALLERTEIIVNTLSRFLVTATENVILDISSLPKRFFFPFVRLLLQSRQVKNLLVTYTVPEGYTGSSLAEDPEPWRHIPLFAPPYPEPEAKIFFVSVGFETLGLPGLLQDDFHSVAVKLMFPFPASPPTFQRTWEFTRMLESKLPRRKLDMVRVSPRDCADAFDHICSITDKGSQYSMFAPYGPKPVSLAIAIYASLYPSAVLYTQPRVYNPEYSTGVAQTNNMPAIYGYCLRLAGEDLYRVSD